MNFLHAEGSAFTELGMQKRSIRFGRESDVTGELYLLTAALTLTREWTHGELHVSPMVTTAQRRGMQLAGTRLGIDVPLTPTLDAGTDIGVPFGGNMLTETGRVRALVVDGHVTWRVSRAVALHAAAGNGVGLSPFHALRARAEGGWGVRLGISARRLQRRD
ncbi:MAG: hypothetical protein U0163_14565 [Gemmatimonadaceae bacterium]